MARPLPISLRQDHLAEIAHRGVPVPDYDRARLEARIVHVGVGGFHRAHLARQWVVEDEFAAGRPRWEDAGALFSDRVHDWELYKLRMLNAGHSCMAYLSALAGITYVHEAMATPAVQTFLETLLYCEAMPTVVAIPDHPREQASARFRAAFSESYRRIAEHGPIAAMGPGADRQRAGNTQ